MLSTAYIFSTSGHTVFHKLGYTILPQIEDGSHGARVVSMFFLDDNVYVLRQGDALGQRLIQAARAKKFLVLACSISSKERGLASGGCDDPRRQHTDPPRGTALIDGVTLGCWPDLYAHWTQDTPDTVITI